MKLLAKTVEERYQTAAGVEAALRSASRHASRWADRPVPAPHTERASDRLMMVQEIVLAPLGSTMSSASSPTLCIACRSARCPGTTGALDRRPEAICYLRSSSYKSLANRRKIRYPYYRRSWNKHRPDRANPIMKSSSTSERKVIRVLIADDHPVVREGLVTILKSEKDIEVVAEAADGEETCELYRELAPDVLLLDLRMPEKDGLQVITELMSQGEPKPRIIVMTTYESEGDVRRVLKAGAKGYLVKGADPEQIREAIRKVAAGQSLLQPEIASKLAESMARPELSERELQVLQSMALGRSNKEIGQVLYISENTVKGHVKSILTKLDAIGRTEAIAIANKRGLIQTS